MALKVGSVFIKATILFFLGSIPCWMLAVNTFLMLSIWDGVNDLDNRTVLEEEEAGFLSSSESAWEGYAFA